MYKFLARVFKIGAVYKEWPRCEHNCEIWGDIATVRCNKAPGQVAEEQRPFLGNEQIICDANWLSFS